MIIMNPLHFHTPTFVALFLIYKIVCFCGGMEIYTFLIYCIKRSTKLDRTLQAPVPESTDLIAQLYIHVIYPRIGFYHDHSKLLATDLDEEED